MFFNKNEIENIFLLFLCHLLGIPFILQYRKLYQAMFFLEILYNLFQFIRCSYVEIIYKINNIEKKERYYRNKSYINFVKEKRFDNINRITYQYKTCNQNVFSNHSVLKNINIGEFILFNNGDVFQDDHYFEYPKKLLFNTKVIRFHNMSFIPPFIKYSKCKILDISANSIERLENLPKNVVNINANHNLIQSINIKNNYLQSLSAKGNILREIEIDSKNLVRLDLSYNLLRHLKIKSENLLFLDLSSNHLETLPHNLEYNQLQNLNINTNHFVVIPDWILEIPTLNLMNNPIMPNLNSEMCQLFLQEHYPYYFVTDRPFTRVLYEDNENIHNHTIHESLLRCLEEIQQIYFENKEVVDTIDYVKELESKVSKECFSLIREVCLTKDNYGNLKINFEKTIKTIWFLIKNKENVDEIVKIIEEEIISAKGKCYTGYIGRLINSIMGFEILNNRLEISMTDAIIAKYMYVKNKIEKENKELEEDKQLKLLKKHFIEELQEIGISKKDIDIWTEPLQNN